MPTAAKGLGHLPPRSANRLTTRTQRPTIPKRSQAPGSRLCSAPGTVNAALTAASPCPLAGSSVMCHKAWIANTANPMMASVLVQRTQPYLVG
jgi:hypothetical protein